MHIHILGICGTFMGSLAILAREAGHRVTGSDANVYPPMSTQLELAGIALTEGYDPAQLRDSDGGAPDLVVVGNAMSRGNPCVEYVLNHGLPYTSGPQWLGDYFLRDKWVLAVAGTHGKTTTTAMLAWILEDAGLEPGFLVGGVPANFGVSARRGGSSFFVVEADEYDTAFFDKRSKFVHYRPRTLILNNLEFDHADIFPDLAAIQTQFSHLVRTVPGEGLIVHPEGDANLAAVLARGCWTPAEPVESDSGWRARLHGEDGGDFEVLYRGGSQGRVTWHLSGLHNVRNALAAVAAARHAGVRPEAACGALSRFAGVKRRMELIGEVGAVRVYDDFAHHPTAIATTLDGLRKRVGGERIVAVIEPRSNTMKLGIHKGQLAAATAAADLVLWFQPDNLGWSLAEVCEGGPVPARCEADIEGLVAATLAGVGTKGHVVVMSNGGFSGFHGRLLAALDARESNP
ncbi:MAG: UDP-N-acetylmuramate:L-alanyl-gamma-D-glutamyl-meso-diaminopimelate ligase [Pseudomonadota bacterium]|nr:UDP-N-acetylmuramate:L-alanyl-gamma-D-glutamyl-meso-diaminopimelate ligase [Pseudomonadota bacterium]